MKNGQRGFTLADVLIALALLGIISSFIIPKMLQSTQNQESTSKYLEAQSILESAWYNKKFQNSFVSGTNERLAQNVGDILNAIQFNPTATRSSTLTTQPTSSSQCNTQPGFAVFHDGILISGLFSGPDIQSDLSQPEQNAVLCIDTNGDGLPNVSGVDTFYADFNASGKFDTSSSTTYSAGLNANNFYWSSGGSGGIQTVYQADGTAGTSMTNTGGNGGLIATGGSGGGTTTTPVTTTPITTPANPIAITPITITPIITCGQSYTCGQNCVPSNEVPIACTAVYCTNTCYHLVPL